MQALQARIDGLVLKDPLTGDAQPPRPPRRAARGDGHLARPATRRSPWSCSTSTTSRRSTTPPATPPATRRCGSPRACSRASCARATSAAGSAATSSCSPCPTPTPGAPSAWSSGCAARSRPAPMRDGRAGMTFSAGIAEFPRDARDQIGLMRLAEGALYRAKRSGRNRCVVYSSFVDAPLSLQEEAERARTAGLANTVYALARAVDLKDGYTHQHSARVAQYAAVLAREFGMSEEEIDQIRTAGILHDVGKVGVADAVLLKPARLTDDEFLEMQRHSDARPRHRRRRGHARDRRVGALPARALGRPRLPREARGRRHPARQPRARRRRRVRGDDLLAPVPARHGGREGARRAREVRRQAVRPRRRARGWSSSSARARSRSARSASST